MLGAIKYGWSNLFNFNGRDSRQTFWYFVLFLYLLGMVIGIVILIPVMVQIISSTIAGVGNHSRDPAAIQAQSMALMAQMMRPMIWMTIIVGIFNMVMLAASLVRRLHDSDLSGYWALLPAGAQAIALAMMPATMDHMLLVMQRAGEIQQRTGNPFAAQSEMMGAQGIVGLLGWIPLVLMILIGIRASTAGPNRFGETTVQY